MGDKSVTTTKETVATPVKETAKKTTAKTTTAKKTTTAAKKPAAKKTTAKKEAMAPVVMVQMQGQEAAVADVVERAKAQFVSEGHKAATIKDLQIYIKPEEFAAYYVVNGKFSGRINLF